jgi:hypothetical protein
MVYHSILEKKWFESISSKTIYGIISARNVLVKYTQGYKQQVYPGVRRNSSIVSLRDGREFGKCRKEKCSIMRKR